MEREYKGGTRYFKKSTPTFFKWLLIVINIPKNNQIDVNKHMNMSKKYIKVTGGTFFIHQIRE